MVVKFEEKIDGNDDEEFSRQFRKSGDVWSIMEYTEVKCAFFEMSRCNRVQYKNELDDFFADVAMVGGYKQNNEKRYSMYHGFIWIKYGSLGSNNRRNIDDCVEEFIYRTFPVEVGKRKQGFIASKKRRNRINKLKI